LRLWDLRTGKLVRTFSQGVEIHDLALLAADAMSAIALDKTYLRVWRLDSARELGLREARLHKAQQILHDRGEDAEALREIGEWYAYRGRWDWAGELLERAEKAGASVSSLTLARCAWMTGRMEDAERFFQRAGAANEAPADYLKLCSAAAQRVDRQMAELPLGVTSQLVALSDEIRTRPDDPLPLARRSRLYIRGGRFEAALADFDLLVQLAPDDQWHTYQRGCLLAYLGRQEEYREQSQAMLAQFSDSGDWRLLERSTKLALLLPVDAGSDVERLTERAWKVQAMVPNDPWSKLLVGMAEYRAGRFDTAITWLEKCRATQNSARNAAVEAYLAMAYHGLKREVEAGEALARCAQLAEEDLPAAGKAELDPGVIQDWLIAHIAHREAQQMIDSNPAAAVGQEETFDD
jgi:tetratricopeptide (TPR) repeat protein